MNLNSEKGLRKAHNLVTNAFGKIIFSQVKKGLVGSVIVGENIKTFQERKH